MTQDEDELLRLLRDRHTREKAFTSLVRKYQETLYWQIRRIVLTHENADDVLQNVFIKAWGALDAFKGDSRISTWLYRIALNESLNYIQRQKQTGSIDDVAAIVHSLEGDAYFSGDEVQRMLQEAIAQLPDKQRAVFNLKYFQDISYQEMSQMMGTSVGALKASYHHAVRKIYDFFERHD